MNFNKKKSLQFIRFIFMLTFFFSALSGPTLASWDGEKAAMAVDICGKLLEEGKMSLRHSDKTKALGREFIELLVKKWRIFSSLNRDVQTEGHRVAEKGQKKETYKELELLKMFNQLTDLMPEYKASLAEIQAYKDSIEGRELDEEDKDLLELFEDTSDGIVAEMATKIDAILDYVSTWYQSNAIGATIEIKAKDALSESFVPILERMYLRYAESQGWKSEVLTRSNANQLSTRGGGVIDQAGFVTLDLRGDGVFKALEMETGIHRLKAKIGDLKGTSVKKGNEGKPKFVNVSVAVIPIFKKPRYEIHEEDLREETFRSSGAGGQHVNTTDSAVRITHIPTGLSAAISNERSQHANRARAREILLAKLQFYHESQRALEDRQTRDSITQHIEDSSAIRTYDKLAKKIEDAQSGGSFSIDILNTGNLNPLVARLSDIYLEGVLKDLITRAESHLNSILEIIHGCTKGEPLSQIDSGNLESCFFGQD